jgi:hypothetical protein
VSSLYRCRARVGYKPFRSSQIILFDERQIQDLSVKLKWEPNLSTYAAEGVTAATGISALSQSTCSVTVTDPYLSGIAWPALYDAASLYSQSTLSAANGILLPACKEGEDPVVNKCTKYADLESGNDTNPGGDWALLYLSLWYDVAGTSFGSDFYFRVNGLSVSHGTKYPSATIKGTDARSIVFNQSLVNLTFDQGTEVEKAIKDVVELMGYEPQFCANTNEFPEKQRLLPKSIRFKGVTPDEAIKKLIGSTNGNTLSLPTQQWANKVSICARGDVNQGCTVFYLGRGLYEGYELSATPELSLVQRLAELGTGLRNDGDPYVAEGFGSQLYALQDPVPNIRKETTKNLKKVSFPGQFEPTPPHIKSARRASGYVWRNPARQSGTNSKGKVVINETLKDVNLYGIAPNGTTAISFLSGKVKEASEQNKKVLIDTNFFLLICKPEDDKKCFVRKIRQETLQIGGIKVKAGDEVKINQEIGSSTAESPEFTQFFIDGHKGERVAISPEVVWEFATPDKEASREAIKAYLGKQEAAVTTTAPAPAPASGDTPPPAPQLPEPQQSSPGFDGFVGRVGSTGNSTGPHLHVQESVSKTLTEAQLEELAGKYITVSNKPVTSFKKYRGYQSGHRAIDYAIEEGEPINIAGQVISAGRNVGGSRCGNGVAFKPPEGPELLMCHLKDATIPSNVAGLTARSGGGKTLPSVQSSPVAEGLLVETSFKGVPRSLRIIPGRTILSFITDYDAWLENGGHRGKDAQTDPGVWIPKRFSNWFVKSCEYKWRDGDLRVNVEGASQWGTAKTSVPTFPKYLEQMTKDGIIKNTTDYYGYIRSIGDLNWRVDGKDSTEVECPEAQGWANNSGASSGPDTTSPAGTQGAFPTAKCVYTGTRYPADRVQKIINAARAGGITTKAGFAGVVGNAVVESSARLDPAISNFEGSGAFGVFQWLGSRRRGLEAFARGLGKSPSDFDVQMQWFVKELQGADQGGPPTVRSLNGISDPRQASDVFCWRFERALINRVPNTCQKGDARRAASLSIFNDLKCE